MTDFLSRFYGSPGGVEKKYSHRGEITISKSFRDVVVGDFYLRKPHAGRAFMNIATALILCLIPVLVIAGTYIFKKTDIAAETGDIRSLLSGRIYYVVSLLIIVILQIPFFLHYEKNGHDTRTATRIASMVALNVAGRAAFFMFSDFKPVYAFTIISGIAFGSAGGFMTGALTMLISNFLFGQGPWTPWQMLALGLIGFISGVLTERGMIPRRRLALSVFGFFMAIVVYGGIMNPAAMLLSVAKPSIKLLAAYYISGIPVDLVKGAATFVFLWIAADPLLKKIERVSR